MDARVFESSVEADEPWQPSRGVNGKVEIGINYLHPTGRMTFDAVSPEKYLELWSAFLLKHQQNNSPKPRHLPEPSEVRDFLAAEKSGTAKPSYKSPKQRKAEGLLHYAALNSGGAEVDNQRYEPPEIEDTAEEPQVLLEPEEPEMATADAHVEEIGTAGDVDPRSDTDMSSRRRGTTREDFLARVQSARRGGSYLNNFPPVHETAEKVATLLDEEQRDLFAKAFSKEWGSGGRQEYAKAQGIGLPTLSRRLAMMYGVLGLENQPKRKKYLIRVLKYYDKHKGDFTPAPVGQASDVSVEPPINGHAAESQLPVAVPTPQATAAIPVAVVRADETGAFLVKPPPGAKRITITIDL